MRPGLRQTQVLSAIFCLPQRVTQADPDSIAKKSTVFPAKVVKVAGFL